VAPGGTAGIPCPDAVLPLAAAGPYDLHSRQHLGAKDLPPAGAWLDRAHPLFGAFLAFHNQRTVRRKELYETLFALHRLAPELARAEALCELSAGHGLFGLLAALLLPDLRGVIQADRREPDCYEKVRERLAARWPYVKVRTRFVRRRLVDLTATPRGVLVVAVHACGELTDQVAALARAAEAPFAVVPCCEGRLLLDREERAAVRGEDIPAIVNERRIARWRAWGYEVEERRLPEQVTERPRLLVATPRASGGPS